MFEKIPLNKLYIDDYVNETLEYVYGGIYNSTSIIHHFNYEKYKSIFVLITDKDNNFIGYMNLFDNKIYNPLEGSFTDYEEKRENIDNVKDVDGFTNFEPLSNYNSKYIRPYMSIKLAKKAIYDINKQKEKIKSLVFKN